MDGICYQARDMEMERFREDVMRAIARCQALLEEAQQPQEPHSASSRRHGCYISKLVNATDTFSVAIMNSRQ